MRALIGLGAQVDHADATTGYTALHYAVRAPSDVVVDVISLLIGAGADVNAVSRITGVTPLHEAARDARACAAIALLAHGAGPSVARRDSVMGRTPLHWAMSAREDACEVLATELLKSPYATKEVLLARDRHGSTALHLALECGSPGALEALVKALHRRWLVLDALSIPDGRGALPDSGTVLRLVRG